MWEMLFDSFALSWIQELAFPSFPIHWWWLSSHNIKSWNSGWNLAYSVKYIQPTKLHEFS